MLSSQDDEFIQLLEDFKNSSASDERKNAKQLLIHHRRLFDSLRELIEEKYNEPQISEYFCQELLQLYYRGAGSTCFCMQMLPILIGTYMCEVGHGNRKYCAHMEALLLSIYNNEIARQYVKENGVEEVRLSSLTSPSIYHKDPSTFLSGSTLIDNTVSRRKSNYPAVVQIGPYPSCGTLNAENRFLVITRLWKQFNDNLSFVCPSAVLAACKICAKLCGSGFELKSRLLSVNSVKSKSPLPRRKSSVVVHAEDYSQLSRLQLHPSFMLEMLNTLNFAAFSNELVSQALVALDLLNQRATFELYPRVLLVVNALFDDLAASRNLSTVSATSCTLSVDESSASLDVSRRSAPNSSETPRRRKPSAALPLVTNASLRIKKLPDDIKPWATSIVVAPTTVTSSVTSVTSSATTVTSSEVKSSPESITSQSTLTTASSSATATPLHSSPMKTPPSLPVSPSKIAIVLDKSKRRQVLAPATFGDADVVAVNPIADVTRTSLTPADLQSDEGSSRKRSSLSPDTERKLTNLGISPFAFLSKPSSVEKSPKLKESMSALCLQDLHKRAQIAEYERIVDDVTEERCAAWAKIEEERATVKNLAAGQKTQIKNGITDFIDEEREGDEEGISNPMVGFRLRTPRLLRKTLDDSESGDIKL